jgi:hypothetical protein
LNAAQLRSKLQDLFLGVEQFIGTLLVLARPDGLHPLVQAVARDAQTGGDFLDRMTTLSHLADGFVLEFGRVSLLVHGTPPTGSMLASEVSTIPGEVHSDQYPEQRTGGAAAWGRGKSVRVAGSYRTPSPVSTRPRVLRPSSSSLRAYLAGTRHRSVIEQLAQERGISFGEFVRRAVDAYIKRLRRER